MPGSTPASPQIAAFIQRLDQAVSRGEVRAICEGIKRALVETVSADAELLPVSFLQPSTQKYARRLLHKDPAGRYSAVVMVWGPGQGTPVHDHAGQWCVECVYRGRIKVTSYDIEGKAGGERPVRFKQVGEVTAGVSEAGALIPPYEYHKIENPDSTSSVTIHIYCGEMTWYNAYYPAEGGYRLERRETYYTP